MDNLDELLSYAETTDLFDLSALVEPESKQVVITQEKPASLTATEGGAVIVKTKNGETFVYKRDVNSEHDELFFVAYIFLRFFGLETPETALVKFPYTIKLNYGRNGTSLELIRKPSYAQSIEYISNLEDFTIESMKDIPNYAEKLGKIIAFYCFVGEFDNFMVIGNYIHDAISGTSLYEEMDEDELTIAGNIFVREDNFLVLDVSLHEDVDHIKAVHKLAKGKPVEIIHVFSKAFGVDPENEAILLSSFRRNFSIYSKFTEELFAFHEWALRDN